MFEDDFNIMVGFKLVFNDTSRFNNAEIGIDLI